MPDEPTWLPRALELREKKWSYVRIGVDVGETKQRVYYWLNRARALEKAAQQNALRVTRTCPDCGESFERRPSSMGEGKCYSCSSNRKKTGETRACPCGTAFYVSRSDIKLGRGKYCSNACQGQYLGSPSLLPGVADKISAARTKHGRATGRRQRQLEHAGFTLQAKGETSCRNCGTSEMRLNMHHAIPRSMWKAGITEPLNGVPLCTRCHMGWHHRRLTIYRDIFTAEEWACLTSADLLGQNVEAWLDERYPPRPSEMAA